jgi:hypothetical protein
MYQHDVIAFQFLVVYYNELHSYIKCWPHCHPVIPSRNSAKNDWKFVLAHCVNIAHSANFYNVSVYDQLTGVGNCPRQ